MRIGTWNLAGRWDSRHLDLIRSMDCDVLLLTEVSERVVVPGYALHLGQQVMATNRRWAAVASRLPLTPKPDPHGASALAVVEGLRFCSSILPWRSCGSSPPWSGANTADKTAVAVSSVEASAPDVWGGDWNHALSGREWSGSVAGRESLLEAVDRLGMQVPTSSLSHQIEDLLSIDHIALPGAWRVSDVQRFRALVGEIRISDHDAYALSGESPERSPCG